MRKSRKHHFIGGIFSAIFFLSRNKLDYEGTNIAALMRLGENGGNDPVTLSNAKWRGKVFIPYPSKFML